MILEIFAQKTATDENMHRSRMIVRNLEHAQSIVKMLEGKVILYEVYLYNNNGKKKRVC